MFWTWNAPLDYVYTSDGENDRNRTFFSNRKSVTTATAMRLLNSPPHPRIILLITTLSKNIETLKINRIQLNFINIKLKTNNEIIKKKCPTKNPKIFLM